MNNKTKITLTIGGMLIAFLTLTQSAKGQTDIDDLQYGAYLKASKALWERSVSLSEKTYGPKSFETALATYGLLNNTMATQDEETFDANVDSVVDLLNEIIEQQPELGEPRAILSSVYGLKMAYSPMKGIIYGSKSSSLMEQAIKLEPESPLVQKLYGGSKLYTPEMFGGSPEEAKVAFEKAVELFEKQGTENNWLYLDTLVGLSMAYKKLDESGKSKTTLEKAIKVEPEFMWANSLLNKANQ